MEKIKQYQNVILSLLADYENSPNSYLIADTERHHYQVMRAGWDSQGRYFLRVRLHFHIRPDGKIVLMENRTEDELTDFLMENGVVKSDIIPAFLPESARPLSGYAVA